MSTAAPMFIQVDASTMAGIVIVVDCIHPDEMVPDHDTMLAQLLWLKCNEAEFLRVANITRLAA